MQGMALFFALVIVAGSFPHAINAQALGPGCRYATEADHAAMEARGLPKGFQVCPADEKILGIGRDFDQWYGQLKQQSPCNKNTCALSCRTRNTGAQVCGPTSRRWGSIGCHPNNQTAIFPTVSHGFAAHIELLRRYCGERGRCTIGLVVQQWTATAGDRPAYANFVSKNSGMPVNKVFDPNDIDLMGRIALAMSCFESGSLPYNVDDLRKGLAMAGGGKSVPTPANVGALLQESLVGSFASNPTDSPNSRPGSWTYPATSLLGNSYKPPTPPSSPLPILNQFDTGASGNTSQNASATSGNFVGNLSASAILVQPQTATVGSTLLVSWTSVSMQPSSCKVTSGGSEIATGNESTQKVPASTAGTREFILTCTTATGASVEKRATVQVQ